MTPAFAGYRGMKQNMNEDSSILTGKALI